MSTRSTIALLILLLVAPGCRTWGWGRHREEPEPRHHVVDNFSDTKPKAEDEEEDDMTDTGSFAKKNGRSTDLGSGWSDRSREIERSLGYR
ncbi:hypothetical protein [Bremerella cremea]|uniref:hypothetical protein n=1 Tax=Bremerella cremea TaxID=1031537 RepID=UPI0031EB8FD4